MNSIFISSSFKDMQHERDMLRYKALPQINDYLRKNYGQETTIIDLRWGIDTSTDDERTSMRKIIRTCLYEIDNCKPFMIVLLGDRYGTLIGKQQFEKYISDFEIGDYDNIGVTELEIRYAMHLAETGKMNLFFYFRDMDYSNISDEDKLSIYLDSEESLLKLEKLETLKNEIRKKYPSCCKTYKSSWDDKTKKMDGLDELSDYIFEDIKKCIVNELGSPQKSPICVDDAFIKSKQASFVGRKEELSQIDNFIKSEEYDIAFLQGAVGVGKSALMANVPEILNGDDREYISVFCGQSDSSDTALGVIRNIVYRMRLLLKQTKTDKDESTWSSDRWHQEMDKLIDSYLKNSSKKLVILIDAIDQMVQDIQTQKLYYLPYTHGGKVKVVLSAVTEHKIETFLPSLEHMTTIVMQEPTEQEINKVIDEVWLKYGKPSVSNEIKKELRKKPLSNNYLYINLLLNRLTYIGLEVFSDKNNSEQHIVDNIRKIIASFPDALDGAAEELLNVLGGQINADLANEMFAFLRLSENGLRLTDIQTLCAEKYDASDFSYIKKLIGNFLFERGDHRFDFAHKIFRGINADNIPSDYFDRYFRYASSLDEDDSLLVPFCVHSTYKAKKYVELHELIENWLRSSSLSALAGEKLAGMLEDDKSVANDFVQTIPRNIGFWSSLSFVTNYLLPYAPVSHTTKRLVDEISDRIFSEYNIEDLELENLKLLSKFEECRFNLHYKYSGGTQCETDRYLYCLKEIARKEPSFDNRVAVAYFKLDYDEYWDQLREKYVFTADKDDRKKNISFIGDEILNTFERDEQIDSILLCAKAYIKKADAEYAEIITTKNECAEKHISMANKLINKAARRALKMSSVDKKRCLKKIAECYSLIAKIYMRVDENLYISWYPVAAFYLKEARKYFMQTKSEMVFDKTYELLMDVIYNECIIISREYLEQDQVIEIIDDLSKLLRFVETNMYIAVQSQQVCSLYVLLCAAKVDTLNDKIPLLTHRSENWLYPWSMVYTREENIALYNVFQERDYWFNKGLSIQKYLVLTNRNPGNINRYVDLLLNRLKDLGHFTYRSLETINNATTKVFWGLEEIVVSEDDIEKDKQIQRERKFPILINLCLALKSNEQPNKISLGNCILVAKSVCHMYSWFSNEFLLQFQSQLEEIECFLVNCIIHSSIDIKSFACYLIANCDVESLIERFRFCTCDKKMIEKTHENIKKCWEKQRAHEYDYMKLEREWEITYLI